MLVKAKAHFMGWVSIKVRFRLYQDDCIAHGDLAASGGRDQSKAHPKECSVWVLKVFMRTASLKDS